MINIEFNERTEINKMENEINYWLVGSSFNGEDHQDKNFIENKIWVLGYEKDSSTKQYETAKTIKKNDRIAIKRMLGKGSRDVKILHVGIVEGIINYGNLVTCVVNWIVVNKNIEVKSKGTFGSIHGPYKKGTDIDTDLWLNEIFSL